MGKGTAQKDITIDTASDSQVKSDIFCALLRTPDQTSYIFCALLRTPDQKSDIFCVLLRAPDQKSDIFFSFPNEISFLSLIRIVLADLSNSYSTTTCYNYVSF